MIRGIAAVTAGDECDVAAAVVMRGVKSFAVMQMRGVSSVVQTSGSVLAVVVCCKTARVYGNNFVPPLIDIAQLSAESQEGAGCGSTLVAVAYATSTAHL